MKLSRIFYYAFLLAAMLEVAFHLTKPSWHMYTKPLLMPLLIAYYQTTRNRAGGWQLLIVAALIFSWAGDVLLMVPHASFFVYGLGAFLVAHVCYMLAYQQARVAGYGTSLLLTQRIRYSATVILAGLALIVVIYPNLGGMRVPVIVYATVLVSMSVAALHRYGHTTMKSFALTFLGSTVFIISDGLIAINKFREPVAAAGFWVMSTYLLAQLLIIKGMLAHEKALE